MLRVAAWCSGGRRCATTAMPLAATASASAFASAAAASVLLRSSLLRRARCASTSSPPPAAAAAAAVSRQPPPDAAVPGVPASATAGLSPAALAAWRERAATGASMAVNWKNPGAFGQLARVPAAVIAALPPPRRPLCPQPPGELTARYARALAVALLFCALAAYLHV